ncbi:MAG: hypothetical protein ACOYL3_06050 [Desulfuromonadaceae bacterium]
MKRLSDEMGKTLLVTTQSFAPQPLLSIQQIEPKIWDDKKNVQLKKQLLLAKLSLEKLLQEMPERRKQLEEEMHNPLIASDAQIINIAMRDLTRAIDSRKLRIEQCNQRIAEVLHAKNEVSIQSQLKTVSSPLTDSMRENLRNLAGLF